MSTPVTSTAMVGGLGIALDRLDRRAGVPAWFVRVERLLEERGWVQGKP